MSNKIFGIRDMTVHMGIDEVPTIDLSLVADFGFDGYKQMYDTDWNVLFPGDVVIKCRHCGQWGASKCACRYCGAPIE